MATRIILRSKLFLPGIMLVTFIYKTKSFEMILPISELKKENFLPNLITELLGYEAKILNEGGRNGK